MIARWQDRLARGESVDPSADIDQHPDLAERLRAGFDALRLLRAETKEPGAAAALLGRRLGSYRIDSVLGSGGMGTVYLATPGGGAAGRVAVKVIHPHLFDREGFFKRFLREAEIGRRIRHDNVVRTLDADEHVDGGVRHRFLVMEYVEGRTLRDVLAAEGKLPEALCRHVGREVAAALAAIHAAGAVHRDVKPENVLLTKDHVVKLMDLGVARLTDEAARVSQTGMFVGSLLYGAPEQFRRHGEVDARADLHALGLLLYEIATGVHPFEDDDFRVVLRRIADEVPRRCGEVDPQVSPFFEELVQTLLAKRPEDRLASAQELHGVLGDAEDSAWWHDRAKSLRVQRKRPLRRVRVPRETALVGRDAEIARLRSLYETAKAGEGRVVLVEGEAGIGKSRLVDEFVSGLVQGGEDVSFLFGSYPPGGAATASGAFTTAYGEHFGEDEQALRDALPVTPLLVPAFAALLRGDAAPTGAEPLTRESLQTVFVHATRALAAQRPTIVLIDDLHFAPQDGRALFASIALAAPGHRLLLVGTTRPGIDAAWAGQIDRLEHSAHLHVSRLGPKDLVLLLRDSLKSAHLAEELAAQVAVKSDGNPFFVFEILRGLREGRFLTRKPDGTWITTQSIRELQVPSTITDIVQARISGLGLEDRNLLEAAACIGFEFDPSLLGPVLGLPPVRVLQRLGQIEKAHRLVRSAGRRLVFDHHQLQEVLYAGILEPLREAYHEGIAETIESRSGAASLEPGGVDGAVCADLAQHFLRGARGPRALRYLDAALTHLELNAFGDALLRLADLALSQAGLVAGRARADLLLRRARRLALLGRSDEERRSIEEARSIADDLGERSVGAWARNDLGWHHVRTGRFEEGAAVLEEALALAREVGDRRCEASATTNLGCLLVTVGRLETAREHHERALFLYRALGDVLGETKSTGNLGNALWSLGRFDEACALQERALDLSRRIGDRVSEARANVNLGNVHCFVGRLETARALHERSLAISRAIGYRGGEQGATANLGLVLGDLGRSAEAWVHQERYLALSREVGDRRGIAIATRGLGLLWSDVGRGAEARAHLDEALALSRALGDRPLESAVLSDLARAADEAGDPDAAALLHESALALRRAMTSGDAAESLVEIGDLRRRRSDPDGARAALDEGLSLAVRQGQKDLEALGRAALACLPGGDAPAAVAARADAGSASDSPRARFLLWQATRDRAHLAEAKRLLDFRIEHAPPECRETMLTNVRVNRDVLAACDEQGPA